MVGARTLLDHQAPHNPRERCCEVCRRAIKSGGGRYRVGESEYHPDCFTFWLTAPLAREHDAIGS